MRGKKGHPFIQELGLSLLDIWFPPVCGNCSNPIPAGSLQKLCNDCLRAVEFVLSPVCKCCGTGLTRDAGGEDRYCGDCLKRPPGYDKARSIVYYREPVSTLLLKLKFEADTRATASIGWLIGQAPKPLFQRPYDFIVPVPLHRARLRKRGLNQSLLLAGLMCDAPRKNILPNGLIRVRNSIAQTKLSGQNRRKNLKNAFIINPRIDFYGTAICLVDDVFTTGTTVSECAKTLKYAGASWVDVLTFARA